MAAAPFNFLETLDKVDDAVESNAELARSIAKTALPVFLPPDQLVPGREPGMPPQWSGCAKRADTDKARSTIRQVYRDWSAEGRAERQACYGPVMCALAAERAQRAGLGDDQPFRVLVPGAGLGRLVFDLCLDGFHAEGNEISYHQLLTSSYMLNSCERAGQHTIYPWIHTFSNHKTRANHLRGYAVPDVHCATEMREASQRGPVGEMSMVAADFLCLYGDEDHRDSYDAVASVFFLDTAPNLIRYLETIFHCLKPGGLLVNFGPLLWHFENHAPGSNHGYDDNEADSGDTSGIADPGSFEFSDDEVMALVSKIGFEIVSHETGIEAPYVHDAQSMLQSVYRASMWVARKPAGSIHETGAPL